MKRIIYIVLSAVVLTLVPATYASAQTGSAGKIETPKERKARLEREAAAKKKKQQEAAAKKKREEAARKKREQEAAAQRQREEQARRQREQEEAERKKREQEAQQALSMDDKVYDIVEQMPSFPGGTDALYCWLTKNVKYPVAAQASGVQGSVVVTFIVEKDGSISNVNVIKSVDFFLDNEAIRVVKSMPKWEPGRQNGQTVRVKYTTLPINFRLANNNSK